MKLILSVLLILLSNFALAKVEIALTDEVEVTKKDEYNLFDIVILKRGSARDLEELKKIKVVELSKDKVLDAVRENKEKLQLKVTDDFKIKVQKKLSREEGIRKVKNYLATQCEECIYEVHVNQLTENPLFDFALSEEQFLGKKGSFLVPLTSSTSKVPAWFVGTWKTFKKVPVLNKWIAQNARVSSEDIKEEIKEVTFFVDKVLSKEDLLGKQINRALSAGSIITREMIVNEKLVKKGDTVKLIIKNQDIEVEVQAVAESEGQFGERIKVKTAANKILTGTILEKGQVVAE